MIHPFFSICIAAYNAQGYIDKCLRSIAAQDCSDYEVVIVDDGSVEPLVLNERICSQLPACTLRRTVNHGPYAARQEAFDIAVGKVILCIDADDGLCDCHALSKIRRAFDNEADIVLFNATTSNNNPLNLFDFSLLGKEGVVESEAVWHLFCTSFVLNSLWCKAFRRELYAGADRLRPRLLMAEDRLQSLELMKRASSFWLIDEPLYYYRSNPWSTTNSVYDPSYLCQACYVEGKVLEHMNDSGMKLDEWASYFLQYTSNALLGIRYNKGLNLASRCKAYADVRSESIFNIAFEHCSTCTLHKTDGLRLGLLNDGRFFALDVSMLPWRIGSSLKRMARRVTGMRS